MGNTACHADHDHGSLLSQLQPSELWEPSRNFLVRGLVIFFSSSPPLSIHSVFFILSSSQFFFSPPLLSTIHIYFSESILFFCAQRIAWAQDEKLSRFSMYPTFFIRIAGDELWGNKLEDIENHVDNYYLLDIKSDKLYIEEDNCVFVSSLASIKELINGSRRAAH